jgi:hypothetical protein
MGIAGVTSGVEALHEDDGDEHRPGVWKVDDVATFLDVGRSSVHRLVAAGVIPAMRLSPRILRFDPAAVKRVVLTEGEHHQ